MNLPLQIRETGTYGTATFGPFKLVWTAAASDDPDDARDHVALELSFSTDRL